MQLVGRHQEVAALDGALDGLRERGGSFLLVSGEPGIGKSRLLSELEERARAREHTVLTGRAAEFEREQPFSVFVDALDAHVAALDPERLSRMGVEHVDELGTVLPSLAGHARGDAAQAGDRWRAHRAMRELLDGLAGTRPLVLVLDDLHWADEGSLELLGALVRRPPAGGVLVAAGARPQPSLGALRTAVVQAAVSGAATLVEPSPLGIEDSATLLGAELTGALRARLLHEAGGNPFYLEQLARAPSAASAATAGASVVLEGGFRVPAAVGAALDEELASLAPGARLLLQGAAVAGDPFEVRLAGDVAGMTFVDALDAADHARAAGIVRADDTPGVFRFRHPLVRRAVYERAGDGWRLAAHARAARVLEERGAGPASRAHHVERSAQPGDVEAVALLQTAGSQALARAPASAATWFAAAERLIPETDGSWRRAMLGLRADAALAAGHLEESHQALLAAEELASRNGGLTVDDTLLLAEAETWLGDAHAAKTRLQAARDAAGDEPRTIALLGLRLMLLHLWEGEREEAMENGMRALGAAETAGDPVVLAMARAVLADVASHVDPATATGLHDLAADAVAGFGDDELARGMDALYSLGWSAVHLERHEDALRHFERGMDIARRTGVHRYLVTLTTERAEPLMRLGRVAEAIAVAEEGVEAARLHPSPRFLWWAAFIEAAVRSRAGDLDGAEVALALSQAQADLLPPQVVVTTWMTYERAHILSLRGRHAEALQTMFDGCGGPDLPNIPPNDRQSAWEIMVTAALAREDHAEADRRAAEAEAWGEHTGLHGVQGFAARCRAWVAAAAGDHDAAVAAADASVTAFAVLGSEFDVERSRAVGAASLAALGRKEEAAAVFARAEERFHALGVERDRADAARELRRLGRRAKAKAGVTSVEVGGLSSREQEVAALVHERRTNKEIAETLFLSEKTVESHLRNIFVKLGVTSRLEVAVAVERARPV